MATFVHIADERNTRSIEKSGLVLPRLRTRFIESDRYKFGVFALPLTENFVISHQWVRELKRSGFKVAVAVYFKIPDSELVWVGRYNKSKQLVTATQAVAMLRESEILGFEVIIPRSIKACEINHIRAIPQVLGWRYFPEAKGKPPFCGCSYCQRGNIKSRKLRERYDQQRT